jgi:uncharacterized OB-fold protein
VTSPIPDQQPDPGALAAFASSAATRPFWEGLARGELLIPHCESCERSFFPPRELCPVCDGRAVEFLPATASGTVLAASTVRLPLNGWPAEDVPYTVLLVRLIEEDVVLPGRLGEVAEASVVGEGVEIEFAADREDELPHWRLA